jgi:hypothetical protein
LRSELSHALGSDACPCNEQLLVQTDTGGKICTMDGKINDVLFMPCPPLMLFSHPSLHHDLPLSKRQRNRFVRCFQHHVQKWCETTVLPIDIQIVIYQGMAVLLNAFIKVCPIRIEMPKPVIHNPLIAAAIMVHCSVHHQM